MRVLSAPMRVIWEITNQCNLLCHHCLLGESTQDNNQLSTQDAMRVIQILRKTGICQVGISGGEPLLRSDCLDIARALDKEGISVGMNTNGLLLTRETAQQIRDAQIKNVTISIDGASAQVHDQFRGKQGAWLKAMQAIRYLAAVGVDVMANCVLHRDNANQALDLIGLIKDTGAGAIKFMRLYPIGRAASIYRDYQLSFDTTKSLVQSLLEQKNKLGKDFNVMLGDNLANAYLEHEEEGFEQGECEAGRYKCVIAADGSVRPCEFLNGEEFNAGNIFKKDLREIWRQSNVFNYLRSDGLYSSCRGCKKVCLERCPASAAAIGNIQGPDPTCPRMLKKLSTNINCA